MSSTRQRSAGDKIRTMDIGDQCTLRLVIALLLGNMLAWGPAAAAAAVVYDLAFRAVNQSTLEMSNSLSSSAPPTVTHYTVDQGKVRVGGANAKIIYVFKEQTMLVIDTTAHSAHVLEHATVSQVLAHYADSVKLLQAAAASASAEEREAAERKASDMKLVSDRMRQPVTRDYRVTVRFESADGHACRIWEERENDAKRMELCVAPTSTLPGGAEILSGMKTLSQFRQGADFAFGVDFGVSEWWHDFALLGGVPILVREFKYDSQISEVMLTGMRQAAEPPVEFNIPDGYQIINGPDYTQWFVR